VHHTAPRGLGLSYRYRWTTMECLLGRCVCVSMYLCMCLHRMSAILPASRNHLRRCVNGQTRYMIHTASLHSAWGVNSLFTSTRPEWYSFRCEVRDSIGSADRRRNSMQDGVESRSAVAKVLASQCASRIGVAERLRASK
jgi:hypothetical protein